MLQAAILLAAATILAPSTVCVTALNNICCNSLLADLSLQGKIFLPNSARYAERLAVYYSANAALRSSCIVMPLSTEDVPVLAAIISNNDCQFGIRSGGHSPHAGSNSVAVGVTIDFGYMNAITYTAGSDSVSVAGGQASPVGAYDTVRNFEIVFANGTVVNANANENADLWRAQKGASGNFGFVMTIEFDIQPINKIWGGFIVFLADKATTALRAYVDFVDNIHKYPNSQGLLFIARSEQPDIVEIYDSKVDILSLINTSFLAILAKIRAAVAGKAFSFNVELQPVTRSIVQHGATRGGNVLGLERVVADSPALVGVITLVVETTDLQDLLLALAVELYRKIVAFADQKGYNKHWLYAPDTGANQDPTAAYSAENIALIRAVAEKYDPSGVFQSLRVSGFRIPA
ncbi:hypothetical protein Micbo1qcDRAFT_214774 [Microdochium bolleyi]|uniref:FAD-binding PCMH-type domain-containing protein n=1 Tax=Microdochium bolleyi TaxID=196109 RepID=A0A136IT72_9PEZI|nr:hypothetical protein Micbo1qcDRAFT_214774 [Microdochium bolleyi]